MFNLYIVHELPTFSYFYWWYLWIITYDRNPLNLIIILFHKNFFQVLSSQRINSSTKFTDFVHVNRHLSQKFQFTTCRNGRYIDIQCSNSRTLNTRSTSSVGHLLRFVVRNKSYFLHQIWIGCDNFEEIVAFDFRCGNGSYQKKWINKRFKTNIVLQIYYLWVFYR